MQILFLVERRCWFCVDNAAVGNVGAGGNVAEDGGSGGCYSIRGIFDAAAAPNCTGLINTRFVTKRIQLWQNIAIFTAAWHWTRSLLYGKECYTGTKRLQLAE